MSDQKDDSSGWVLMVLAGVIGLVVAGVLAIAVSTAKRHAPPPDPVNPPHASTLDETRIVRIDFAPGSSALPAASSAALVQIADAARAGAGARLVIHGDPERALTVRHALEANGVVADMITIEPSAPAVPSSGVPTHVEVRLE